MRAALEVIALEIAARREQSTGQVGWDVLPGGPYCEVSVPLGDSAHDIHNAWEVPYGWCVARFMEGRGRWARRVDRGAGMACYRFEVEVTAVLFRLWV